MPHVLYLSTTEGGVVEHLRPATLDDVREVLRAAGYVWLDTTQVGDEASSVAVFGPDVTQGVCTTPLTSPLLATLGGLLTGPPVATDVAKETNDEHACSCHFCSAMPAYCLTCNQGCHCGAPKKESNGSGGHGEHCDTERPEPDFQVGDEKGATVGKKLPSERIAELVAEGPRTSKLGTVGWALDVIGRVMDERCVEK